MQPTTQVPTYSNKPQKPQATDMTESGRSFDPKYLLFLLLFLIPFFLPGDDDLILNLTEKARWYSFEPATVKDIANSLSTYKNFESAFDDGKKLERFLSPGGEYDPDLLMWALRALENGAWSEEVKELIRQKFRRAFPQLFGSHETLKMIPIDDLVLRTQIKNALAKKGFKTLGDILAAYKKNPGFIQRIPGCGPDAQRIIEGILRGAGLL